MITKEQTEGGKLIAEFMGEKISDSGIGIVRPAGWADLFKYHSSWDWLKPVIEKIGNIEYKSINGMREYMNVHFGESKIHIYQKIDVVYAAVVEFIKWYNEAIKQETKKRDNGFYWISKEKSDLSIAKYHDGYWFLLGNDCHYSDYGLKEKGYSVNENRIEHE